MTQPIYISSDGGGIGLAISDAMSGTRSGAFLYGND